MFVIFVTFVTYFKRHHQVLVEDQVKVQYNLTFSYRLLFIFLQKEQCCQSKNTTMWAKNRDLKTTNTTFVFFLFQMDLFLLKFMINAMTLILI